MEAPRAGLELVTQLAKLCCYLIGVSHEAALRALAEAPISPVVHADGHIDKAVEDETGSLLDEIRDVYGYESHGTLTLDLAKWAFEQGEERTKTLDEKAGKLSDQASTTLAIVFGIGGYFLLNQEEVGLLMLPLGALYLCTLALMMQALTYAGKALNVRGEWRALHKADLFNKDVLVSQEREMFLAVAVWKLYRGNKYANDDKAECLQVGQQRFGEPSRFSSGWERCSHSQRSEGVHG